MLVIGGFLLLIKLASNKTPDSDLVQWLAGVFVWVEGLAGAGCMALQRRACGVEIFV